MGHDISGFSGLEPERIITNDGSVDEDTFEVEIRPYVRDYFYAFHIEDSDLTDDELSAMTLAEFQSLLADPERYQADPGFAGTTLASYQRAEDFIDHSRAENTTKTEIPPSPNTLTWPPVTDEVEQVEKLQAMVLPVLDSARESLHNLTTVNSFHYPEDAKHATYLRPMTFNLFVLSLAPYFSSDNSMSIGEFQDSGDYFTGALSALMPDWADYLGPQLATLFGHLNIKDVDTKSMRPLGGMDVLSMASMGALTQNGLSTENANLFAAPDFLVDLAKQLIAANPEILLQLERFERTEVYQQVLKQTVAMEQKITDYRKAVAEVDVGDSLGTQKLMTLIPNSEAQMSLLANLGIDPRIDPNGEKPSWMGDDCWQASRQYVLGMTDLGRQQMVEMAVPIVVMTLLGALASSNPFTALGLAAVSAPGFSWYDIHNEMTGRAHAEAGRVASQALSATAIVVDTPDLATDSNVDDANTRVQHAIEKAPYDLALNALGLGAGAGIKLLYKGAVATVALDMSAQSLIGTSSAVFDQRNWHHDSAGNLQLSEEAVGMAFLFSLLGGSMGHAVGAFHAVPTRAKATGIPNDTFVVIREVEGQQVALSIDPSQVKWGRMQQGILHGEFAFNANGGSCQIRINYNTNQVEFVMPQTATVAPTNSPYFQTLGEVRAWARQQTKAFGCEYSYMRDKNGYLAVRFTGMDANGMRAPTDVLGGKDGPVVNAWFGARLVGHTHDGLPIASFADLDNVAAQTALSGFETTLLTDGVMPNGVDATLTIKVKCSGDQVIIEIEGDAPLRSLAQTDAEVARQMELLDADVERVQIEVNELLTSGNMEALRDRASQPLQTRDDPPQGPRNFPVRRNNPRSAPPIVIQKEVLQNLKRNPRDSHQLLRSADGNPVSIRYDATRGKDGFFVSGTCVIERAGETRQVTGVGYLADGDIVIVETLAGKTRYQFSDPSKVVVQQRSGSETGNASPAYVVPPAVPQGSDVEPTQYISVKPKAAEVPASEVARPSAPPSSAIGQVIDISMPKLQRLMYGVSREPLAINIDNQLVAIYFDSQGSNKRFYVGGTCVVERGAGKIQVTSPIRQYLADGDVVVVATAAGEKRYRFSDPNLVGAHQQESETGNASPAHVVPPAVPQGADVAPTQYIPVSRGPAAQPPTSPVKAPVSDISIRDLQRLKQGNERVPLELDKDGKPVAIYYDGERFQSAFPQLRQNGCFYVRGTCVVERDGARLVVTSTTKLDLAEGDVVVVATAAGEKRYRFSDPNLVGANQQGSESGNAGPAHVVPPAVPQGSNAKRTQTIGKQPAEEPPPASNSSVAPTPRKVPMAQPRSDGMDDLPPGVQYRPFDPDRPEEGGYFRIPESPRRPAQPPAVVPAARARRNLADADTSIPRNRATVVLQGTEVSIELPTLADLKSGRIDAICLGSSESATRVKITYDATSGQFTLHNYGNTEVVGVGSDNPDLSQAGKIRRIEIPKGKSDTLDLMPGFYIVVEDGIIFKTNRKVYVDFPQNSLELAPGVRMRFDPRPEGFRNITLTQDEIATIFKTNNEARGNETRYLQIRGDATLAQEIVLNQHDMHNIKNIKIWCEQACRDYGYTGYELKDSAGRVLYRTRVQ